MTPVSILLVAAAAAATSVDAFTMMPTIYHGTTAQQRIVLLAAATGPLDRVDECATDVGSSSSTSSTSSGECYVKEMSSMIQELELLNAGCAGSLDEDEECDLEAVANRHSLKVSLARNIIAKEAMVANDVDDIDEECDFNAMWEMDDCLNNYVHDIPTAAMTEASLERIVECAEDNGSNCSLEEISDMIRELNHLNEACENTNSRECSLHAREARNILKVALGHQALLVREAQKTNDVSP